MSRLPRAAPAALTTIARSSDAVDRGFVAYSNEAKMELLGVPEAIAKRNALDYYNNGYQLRGTIGGMQGAYYSTECAPGKALDEHLPDSTWGVGRAADGP